MHKFCYSQNTTFYKIVGSSLQFRYKAHSFYVSTMVTICEQCGDRGIPEALIHCDQCQIAARHQYCLDVLPPTFEDVVIWYCDDCESNVAKLTAVVNLHSHSAIKCCYEKLEIVQPTKSEIRFKEKNDVNQVKNEQKRSNFRGSLATSEVRQIENSTFLHIEVHCSENHQKDQKFRRCRELDGNKPDEEAESVKTKTSLIAAGDFKSKPEYNCDLHCSEGVHQNEKLGRETALDGSSSVEVTESFKTKTSLVVTNDPANIPQQSCYDYKQPFFQVCGNEDDKGNNESRKQEVRVTDSSDEGRFARSEAIQNFLSLRQGYDEPVSEYMMKVMMHLNQIELFGAVIGEEMKINMVLSSLSDTFKQFKLDYELNHKDYNLISLMHDLQRAEVVLKGKQGETNVAKTSTSVSVKAFWKDKKKGKWKKKKEPKPKGKCFHCGVDGHWKRNCPIYLGQKKFEKWSSIHLTTK